MDESKEEISTTKSIEPLSNDQCDLLVQGYLRSVNADQSVPSDISRLFVSYFSIWFDLKIVFCDDMTGSIDLTKYQIKRVSIESNLGDLAKQIEEDLYHQEIERTKRELQTKTINDLRKQYVSLRDHHAEAVSICVDATKADLIDNIIMELAFPSFGRGRLHLHMTRRLSCPGYPIVHLWLKMDKIIGIYPIDKQLSMEELEKEDLDRWVEAPIHGLGIPMGYIRQQGIEFLVIEKMQSTDFYQSGNGTWPRAKGDDWRETLQTGDIVEVMDEQGMWYESLVRFVYPTDHKTMAGKCIVNYFGWDGLLDIDSDRIAKRYSKSL